MNRFLLASVIFFLAPSAWAASEEDLADLIAQGDTEAFSTELTESSDQLEAQALQRLLGFAASRGDAEAIEALISSGAALNGDLDGGWTAVAIALVSGYEDLAVDLLALGADPAIPNDDGITALDVAMSLEAEEFLSAVDQQDVAGSPANAVENPDLLLIDAASARDAQAVGEALQAGADPNATDEQGWPVIVIASLQGDLAIIELLIEGSAALDVVTPDGITPLLAAVVGAESIDAVDALLAAGADPDFSPSDKQPRALIAAISAQDVDLVNALLSGGAEPKRLESDAVAPADLARQLGLNVAQLEALQPVSVEDKLDEILARRPFMPSSNPAEQILSEYKGKGENRGAHKRILSYLLKIASTENNSTAESPEKHNAISLLVHMLSESDDFLSIIRTSNEFERQFNKLRENYALILSKRKYQDRSFKIGGLSLSGNIFTSLDAIYYFNLFEIPRQRGLNGLFFTALKTKACALPSIFIDRLIAGDFSDVYQVPFWEYSRSSIERASQAIRKVNLYAVGKVKSNEGIGLHWASFLSCEYKDFLQIAQKLDKLILEKAEGKSEKIIDQRILVYRDIHLVDALIAEKKFEALRYLPPPMLPRIEWRGKKNTIASLQKALKKRGYYAGAIDGISGSGTINAIDQYCTYLQDAYWNLLDEYSYDNLKRNNLNKITPLGWSFKQRWRHGKISLSSYFDFMFIEGKNSDFFHVSISSDLPGYLGTVSRFYLSFNIHKSQSVERKECAFNIFNSRHENYLLKLTHSQKETYFGLKKVLVDKEYTNFYLR
ncbi:ankyrin repeat domain-containing protein [Rhodovulum sp. YNF3179]|uniref:ankyrin repeat domain-containing protein n=1 Tax=Rhodovulum sp. YNF3179 TaxID=3425127 RepID=UPI003D355005